jgi:hypothetical protein
MPTCVGFAPAVALLLLLLLQNFFDAGSCIDGRLTSAWNWCSKIEKKVRGRKVNAGF